MFLFLFLPLLSEDTSFLDTIDRDRVLFAQNLCPFKISTSRKVSSQARLHPPECHRNAGGHSKILRGILFSYFVFYSYCRERESERDKRE